MEGDFQLIEIFGNVAAGNAGCQLANVADASLRQSGPIEHEGGDRQPGNIVRSACVKVIVEKILDSLIDGTEMADERAILFPAEREKMIHERGEPAIAAFCGHTRLSDFA